MRALDALKQAKAQLVELEEQSAFDGDELARAVHMSNDPAAFFSKVRKPKACIPATCCSRCSYVVGGTEPPFAP